MTKEKRDPYKHQVRWLEWKAEAQNSGIKGISKTNSDIILAYLNDMELGLNLGKGCPKDPRKPSRLNDLKSKMVFFSKQFKERFNIDDLTRVTKLDIHTLLKLMKDGVIRKRNGDPFQDTKTFARDFKAFWNWWMKVNAEKDIIIKSIVDDLNTRPRDEAQFTFLKKREIKKLLDDIKFDYEAFVRYTLDTCTRPPTETMNTKVSDHSKDFKEVTIRDETVKKR